MPQPFVQPMSGFGPWSAMELPYTSTLIPPPPIGSTVLIALPEFIIPEFIFAASSAVPSGAADAPQAARTAELFRRLLHTARAALKPLPLPQ